MGRPTVFRLRAVLFDAVGTLIELVEPVGETYARFARARGVSLPGDQIEAAWRRALGRSEARLFSDADASKVAALEREWWFRIVAATFRDAAPSARFRDFEAFFAALFQHFASRKAWKLRAGAKTMLSTLRRRGLHLGIVSNFDHRLPKLLQSLEIACFFDSVTLPATHGVAKPDPKLFLAALDGLGTDPAHALYVGDDPQLDLAAARALGMHAIDATLLESLAELPARLATLTSRA